MDMFFNEDEDGMEIGEVAEEVAEPARTNLYRRCSN